MKTKLAKLIDVKSIMTLMLTLVFCILALIGTISGEQFITIFTVIVGFYFGTQSMKKAEPAVPGYTGPQQGGAVQDALANADTLATDTVDRSTANAIHPPDET